MFPWFFSPATNFGLSPIFYRTEETNYSTGLVICVCTVCCVLNRAIEDQFQMSEIVNNASCAGLGNRVGPRFREFAPSGQRRQEAGITQPIAHSFAQPCVNYESPFCVSSETSPSFPQRTFASESDVKGEEEKVKQQVFLLFSHSESLHKYMPTLFG